MTRSVPIVRMCALALWFACAGCASREHMSKDYGRQSRAFFAKQRVHAAAAEGSPGGLDSEEAAAVRDRYLESLEPEQRNGQADKASRVLVLEEPSGEKSKP